VPCLTFPQLPWEGHPGYVADALGEFLEDELDAGRLIASVSRNVEAAVLDTLEGAVRCAKQVGFPEESGKLWHMFIFLVFFGGSL
jgi:hypothetical protein